MWSVAGAELGRPKMARMSSAFCCTSLKNGTLIIGWLTLVLTIIGLAISSTIIELQVQYVKRVHSELSSRGLAEKQVENIGNVLGIVIIYCISVASVASTVCLLYGVDKGRRGLFVPYLIVFGIAFAVGVISLLYDLCGGESFAPVSVRIVILIISAYFLSIIGSFYAELHPKNDFARHQAVVPPHPYQPDQTAFVELQPTNQYTKTQQHSA